VIGSSVKQIAEILGRSCCSEQEVTGFAVDSRKILPGFLFFALKGEKVDGHNFLEQVKKLGAIGAVVSSKYSGDTYGLEVIRVDDVLEALHKMGAIHAKKLGMKCIAVTGSVGKTTTKEFLYTLLKGSFSVGKTPGNENSQVSLPLHILSIKEPLELFIAEMGMSQKGEITELTSIIPPDLAVVTQVALAHAIYFPGGIEEVAEAKAEILSHPKTKKAFLHTQVYEKKAFAEKSGIEIVSYGGKEGVASIHSEEGKWRICNLGEYTPSFTLPFTARHLVDNFLGAALVAKELGMSWDKILSQAQNLTPYQKRFEIIEKKGVVFVNDSYNANPTSMRAALENLPAPSKNGKVIAALGTMGELGNFSEASHREIGKVAALHTDLLLCFGLDTAYMAEEYNKLGKKAEVFDDFVFFKQAVLAEAKPGDVVLIKASNSLKLWNILEEEDGSKNSVY
jgi:UDP-N-acetylmuramoyl-tripeptide--D-alanyl-D-alanine ligase